jgi:hypothetical protein
MAVNKVVRTKINCRPIDATGIVKKALDPAIDIRKGLSIA